jgi:hypothetical protein
MEGEGKALVLSKVVIFGFGHHPKSTRDILRYHYWSYLHKVISRRLQILKSLVQGYFYFPTVFLVLMTSARITQMFSTAHPGQVLALFHLFCLTLPLNHWHISYNHFVSKSELIIKRQLKTFVIGLNSSKKYRKNVCEYQLADLLTLSMTFWCCQCWPVL